MTVDHHYRLTQQAPQGIASPPQGIGSAPPPPGPPPGPSWTAPPTARRRPQIVPWLALIVAVAALVAVIIDIARGSQEPAPPAAAPATPAYTTEQIDAAKQQTCTAAERSIAGVRVATNRPGLVGPDDALGWANTANARVALLSAAVLPPQVNPATPENVKEAVDRLAISAGDAVSSALTEGKYSPVPADAYDKAIDAFNATSREVQQLCRE